jgi:hypothetical protein
MLRRLFPLPVLLPLVAGLPFPLVGLAARPAAAAAPPAPSGLEACAKPAAGRYVLVGSGTTASAVALDRQGRPRVSLVIAPDDVLSLRYVPQPDQACTLAGLDGLVTSQQQGQSWQEGRWQPNAVVQREWWQAGVVQGWAVSSDAGDLQRAGYSGRLELGADCLGSMVQRDSLGTTYTYRVVVLAHGGGYIYLQTDPDNFTLGLLQHQR